MLDLHSAEPFDRATDFFTAGGDSVLAIRMLNKLRTELGLIVSPRQFLADPTLAATAAGAQTGAASAGGSAVTLRDGTGHPLFLLHTTRGDVLCYVDLARKLDTGRPVIGIQDPALAGAPGPDSITGLARVYEDVLRAHQPTGPYHLGWSMGGIIAHELARRLRAAGEKVAVLALIDANIADRIHHTGSFWSRYLGSLEAFLGVDLESGSLEAQFEQLSEHDQCIEATRRLTEAGLAARDPAAQRLREQTFARHLLALAAHRTGFLDADHMETLVVRADSLSPRNSGVGMGLDDCLDLLDLGWRELTSVQIDTYLVAAHHYTLLHEPAVDTVAELVSRALTRGAQS